MAVIKIKSTAANGLFNSVASPASTSLPAGLALGELAYSFSNNTLVIGTGISSTNVIIGGAAYMGNYDPTTSTLQNISNIVGNSGTALVIKGTGTNVINIGLTGVDTSILGTLSVLQTANISSLAVTNASTFSGVTSFSYANGIGFKDVQDTASSGASPSYFLKPPATDLTSATGIKTFLLPIIAGTTNTSTDSLVSLTSTDTLTNKTWNSAVIGATYGGTGVNNGSNTITLGGNFVTAGASAITLTATAATNVTLPTTGTLATLAGSESFINKIGYNGLVITANTGVITTGTWNGTAIGATYLPAVVAASGTIGLTAVSGSATTGMRSDSTPALSQAIAPTWTGNHIYQKGTSATALTAADNAIALTTTLAATASTASNSPFISLQTNVWNGSASTAQYFNIQNQNIAGGSAAYQLAIAAGAATVFTLNQSGNASFSGTVSSNAVLLDTISGANALINKTGYNGLVITANTGVVTSGTWNAGAVTSSGAISGTSLSATIGSISAAGVITGTSLVLSNGTIGSGAITSTGAISGTTITASTSLIVSTLTSGGVLYGGGSSAISATSLGSLGRILVSAASGPAWSASLGNGQLLIGSAGAAPSAATLSAGAGITVSNSAGTITISSSFLAGTLNTDATFRTVTLTENGNQLLFNDGAGSIGTFNWSGRTAARTINLPNESGTLATTAYVDTVAQGLHVHPPADVILLADLATTVTGESTFVYYSPTASTTTITITGTAMTFTVDSVLMANWTRIVIAGESSTTASTSSPNKEWHGIYTKTTSTTTSIVLTRASDADNVSDLNGGDFIFIQSGTIYADTGFVQTVTNSTLGTIAFASTNAFYPTFVQFSHAGVILAGNGLTKNGTTLDVVGTTDRISVLADSIDIASTYVGQNSITTVGTVTSGTIDGGTF